MSRPGCRQAFTHRRRPWSPNSHCHVDADSARLLADWYELADTALRRLAADIGAAPQEPILWPEHFDIGITIGPVNYGGSPGDDHVAEPYLYVGPHDGPPVRDEFWNAAFGAARTIDEITSVDDAVAFFRAGHDKIR